MLRVRLALLCLLAVASVALPSNRIQHSADRHSNWRAMKSVSRAARLVSSPMGGRLGKRTMVLQKSPIGNATRTPASNSTHPGDATTFCDRVMTTSFTRLMSVPSCQSLMTEMSQDPPDLSLICGNSCWKDFVDEILTLNGIGCFLEADGHMLKHVCEPVDCTKSEAASCVSDWLSMGCPDEPPSEACTPYISCGLRSMDQCSDSPAPQAQNESLAFTVSLPLDIEPALFVAKYGNDYLTATAKSAGVSRSSCTIKSVRKGSVIVETEIVGLTTASAVSQTLSASLSGPTFLTNLNKQFNGSLVVNGLLVLSPPGPPSTTPAKPTPSTNDTSIPNANVTFTPNRNKTSTPLAGSTRNKTSSPAPMPTPSTNSSSYGTQPGQSPVPTSTSTPMLSSTSTSTPVLSSTPTRTARPPSTTSPTPFPTSTITHFRCPHNCSDHGKCVSAGNGIHGKCQCNKGYGRSNVSAVQDCSEFVLDMCTDSCSGRGDCVPTPEGTMACKCYQGFTGDTCALFNGCESLSYCSGHGNCSRSFSALEEAPETCICLPGYTGAICDQLSVGCPDNCLGRGTCTTNSQRQSCACNDYFSGPNCGQVTGPACPNMCSGLGECMSEGNCSCVSGTSGSDCSQVTNTCGYCFRGFCNQGKCECIPGYQGAHCDQYNATLDTDCAALNFCSGTGVCARTQQDDGSFKSTCTCFEGFSGTDCSFADVNFEDQCPNHCSGNGKCVLGDSLYCNCFEGWTGKDCAQSQCPSANGKTCSAHGICEKNGAGDFVCTCDPAYNNGDAKACENSVCNNDCNGHGSCNPDGTCTCKAGYSGLDCSVASSTAARARLNFAEAKHSTEARPPAMDALRDDEETGSIVDPSSCLNSCSKHGDCVMGKCQCKKGYTGDDCSKETPDMFEESDDLDKLDLLEMGSESNAHGTNMAGLWI